MLNSRRLENPRVQSCRTRRSCRYVRFQLRPNRGRQEYRKKDKVCFLTKNNRGRIRIVDNVSRRVGETWPTRSCTGNIHFRWRVPLYLKSLLKFVNDPKGHYNCVHILAPKISLIGNETSFNDSLL